MDSQNTENHYIFEKSKTGKIVPAIIMPDGKKQYLHSMVDPEREAQRLISTVGQETRFLILLGLGGSFLAEAALAQTAAQVVVIDFDINGITEILSSKDYSALFGNNRFSFLVDKTEDEIICYITENYLPALYGNIQVIPLKTRTIVNKEQFEKASAAIKKAIENVSSDFTVQSHFGKRWFSNIISNLPLIEKRKNIIPQKLLQSVENAAIVAAGPSLDIQIKEIANFKKNQVFIICCDTALGSLLHNGIEPDVIVSIDCQHISYYHFMSKNINHIPLILDIASPRLLSHFSTAPVFFSSGHPLSLYISQNFYLLPVLDTSGGNVTYTCLSLAEQLGAKRITVFGADFSYIGSQTYARGTYIYPFFERKQNRLSPAQAQHSAFLYRSEFILPEQQLNESNSANKNEYRETAQLRFYRKKFEQKAAGIPAQITIAKGIGAPIKFESNVTRKNRANINLFCEYKNTFDKNKNFNVASFLENYRNDIAALPAVGSGLNYLQSLDNKNRQIFITLLPLLPPICQDNPKLKTGKLIEEVKMYCMRKTGNGYS